MLFWLILKLFVVIGFFIMFLRGSKLVWGIGLLTVTTAFLFDTFLGAFGVDDVAGSLGFFYSILSGMLFGGAFLWLVGLLRPSLFEAVGSGYGMPVSEPASPGVTKPPRAPAGAGDPAGTAFDRQMLYDQIRHRFGPSDVLDLIFDLRINENDVLSPQRGMPETIVQVMDIAAERGKTAELALAVERILTPPPAENLPRLERLNAESPPTVLRHYLINNYNIAEIQRMMRRIGVDPEMAGTGSKQDVVRGLLLYVDRRNRLAELIDEMKAVAAAAA